MSFKIGTDEYAPASDKPKVLVKGPRYHIYNPDTKDNIGQGFKTMLEAVQAAKRIMDGSRLTGRLPLEIKVSGGGIF